MQFLEIPRTVLILFIYLFIFPFFWGGGAFTWWFWRRHLKLSLSNSSVLKKCLNGFRVKSLNELRRTEALYISLDLLTVAHEKQQKLPGYAHHLSYHHTCIPGQLTVLVSNAQVLSYLILPYLVLKKTKKKQSRGVC